MRIAMLCTDLGIRVPDDTKGASIHLLSVARALSRSGHDVLLVGVAGHEPPPAELETLVFPHPGRSEGLERERRKLAFVERVVGEAGEPIAAFAPDVIYERLALFGDGGRRLARRLDVPHVVEVNALLAREEADWRGLHLRSLATRRERQVLEGADACVAVSAQLRRQILEVAPDARIAVVPNGVETSRFLTLTDPQAARRALGLPRDALLAVFVGALRPWHGVDVAISALALLPPEVHLVVAGDGPERARLEASASDAIARRIHWLGQLSHSDIPLVLAAADVAVAPYPALSDFAFSPLKLFEYLTAGVPVVASDLGQIREVLENGAHGCLVQPGDAFALAAGIVQSLTVEARSRAGAARSHALATHGWDARAIMLIDLLETTIERRNRDVVAR